MGLVEDKLRTLGYRKSKGNTWINGNRTVHVQHSDQYNRDQCRIVWKQKWKEEKYHALIFDYSSVQGPICIVPTDIFFNNSYVSEKCQSEAFKNSGYWWSQIYPSDHELTCLILQYKDRWDIIETAARLTIQNPTKPVTEKTVSAQTIEPEQTEVEQIEVIIDGSNVAYDNIPKGQPPRYRNIVAAFNFYQRKKMKLKIIVDANLRWKIDNKDAFGKAIDEKLIYQAPSGVRADEYILKLALIHPKSKIVSNDEFRDWRENINFKEINRDRLTKFRINGEFIEFSRM